jgi:hypothetical protein
LLHRNSNQKKLQKKSDFHRSVFPYLRCCLRCYFYCTLFMSPYSSNSVAFVLSLCRCHVISHIQYSKGKMPTTTDRTIAIQELEDITNERAVLKTIRDDMDSPDEDEDDIDDMYEYQLELIKNKKYYNDRQPYRRGYINPDWNTNTYEEDDSDYNQPGNLTEHPWLTEDEFRQKYRVSRKSFDTLLGLIKNILAVLWGYLQDSCQLLGFHPIDWSHAIIFIRRRRRYRNRAQQRLRIIPFRLELGGQMLCYVLVERHFD